MEANNDEESMMVLLAFDELFSRIYEVDVLRCALSALERHSQHFFTLTYMPHASPYRGACSVCEESVSLLIVSNSRRIPSLWMQGIL